MSSGSWLKSIKTRKDFFEADVDIDYNDPKWVEREGRAEEKRISFLRTTPPLTPELHRYFHSRLHDSYVISTEQMGKAYVVNLSHDATEDVVADFVAHRLRVQCPNCIWPIKLVFSDVSYLRWAHVDSKGAFRFWRPSWSPVDGQSHVGELLSDRFTTEGTKLQWLAEFWRWKDFGKSEPVYLMLECASCQVVDQRENAFVACFGEGFRGLWRRLEAKFPDLCYYQQDVIGFLEECPELQA